MSISIEELEEKLTEHFRENWPNRKPVRLKEMDGGCWHVTSHKVPGKYPAIRKDGENITVSRLVQEMCNSKIPEGHVARHKCDNMKCVNPEHICSGTVQDNVNDKIERNRQPRGITAGMHKLTEENVRAIFLDSIHSEDDLCSIFKVEKTTLGYIRRKNSWKHITSGLQRITLLYEGDKKSIATSGTCNGNSKLTEQQISTIVEEMKSEPCAKIAEKYGVSPSLIQQIRRGESWKHVTGGDIIPVDLSIRKKYVLKGDTHPQSKINSEIVKKILAEDRKIFSKILADKYSVSASLIRQIRQGKAWKSIHQEDNNK